MSDYKAESNKYKAKRTGQIDAKVVAPKGRKKKVDKPWCVVTHYDFTWARTDKPYRNYFQHEHDARAFLRKEQGWKFKRVHLEHNGKEVP